SSWCKPWGFESLRPHDDEDLDARGCRCYVRQAAYSFDKGGIMRRKVMAIALAGAFAFSVSAATALADNPHAGNSGHFKGSAGPCDSGSNNPNCPPFGK